MVESPESMTGAGIPIISKGVTPLQAHLSVFGHVALCHCFHPFPELFQFIQTNTVFHYTYTHTKTLTHTDR